MKQNCWEYKKCGRQPQGVHARQLGVCPASLEESLDGVHDGTNAGRSCWVVAGTLCGGAVQGTFGAKYKSCELCDFYQRTRLEERTNFKYSSVLLNQMRSRKGEAGASRAAAPSASDGSWQTRRS
ncbi:MAG: two-CW domain-containing protein [Nitrospirota bacterium]